MPGAYLDQGKTDNDTFRYFSLYFPPTFPLRFPYVSPSLYIQINWRFTVKGKWKRKDQKANILKDL